VRQVLSFCLPHAYIFGAVMTNLLNHGLDWLEQNLLGFCSSPVDYRRESETIAIDAVFGKTDYQVSSESGVEVGAFIWDFLMDADALGMTPEVGDIVVVDGKQFEVMNLSGQGCWRWTGPNQKTVRVHTKEIGSDV
jgi:hypothetical protein